MAKIVHCTTCGDPLWDMESLEYQADLPPVHPECDVAPGEPTPISFCNGCGRKVAKFTREGMLTDIICGGCLSSVCRDCVADGPLDGQFSVPYCKRCIEQGD